MNTNKIFLVMMAVAVAVAMQGAEINGSLTVTGGINVDNGLLVIQNSIPYIVVGSGVGNFAGDQMNMSSASLQGSSVRQLGLNINPAIQQSGTASYVALQINPIETSLGSGTHLLLSAGHDGTAYLTIDDTGALANSGTTSLNGLLKVNSGIPYIQMGGSVGNFSGDNINFSLVSLSGSSVSQTAIHINPQIAQSGTASFIALNIDPTETSTGSGAHTLINAAVGGTSKWSVSDTGYTKALALQSTGTTFTLSGCGTTSSLTGGATFGRFSTSNTGACNAVVTMGGGATAANGWSCAVSDQTTGNLFRVSASNGTTATLSGVSAASDTISFACFAY